MSTLQSPSPIRRAALTGLSVRQYPAGPWSVIALSGEIDVHLAPAVREALASAATCDVVCELSGVTFMDSAGFRVLREASLRTRSAGGSLRLAAPTAGPRRILAIAGLHEDLPVYDSVDEATR